MNYIDAHVHVWTPDTAHYPLVAGFKKDDMKPPSFTPQELFKHSTPAGVTRINLIQMSLYGFDNAYMLDAIKLYPEVFVGTAVIDPSAEPVKRMRELAPKGVRAFRIHPRLVKAEKWLEPDGYAEMFVEGAKANQAISCLINPTTSPSWTACVRSTRTRRSSSTTCAASVATARSARRTWTHCARWRSTNG